MTCISCIVKDVLISKISFGILYIFKGYIFYKCFSLIESSIKSACSLTNKNFNIAFKVFQAISEFVRGNVEPCR